MIVRLRFDSFRGSVLSGPVLTAELHRDTDKVSTPYRLGSGLEVA